MKKQTATTVTVILEMMLSLVGSFLLYVGAWNYLFSSPIPGILFGILLMIFGLAVMVFSIINATRLYAFLLGQPPPP